MPKHVEMPQNPRSLRNIADRLKSSATALEVVATTMELEKLETLSVSHYVAMSVGIQKVESFAHAAKSAIYGELGARGHFRANEPPIQTEQPEKRKRA